MYVSGLIGAIINYTATILSHLYLTLVDIDLFLPNSEGRCMGGLLARSWPV